MCFGFMMFIASLIELPIAKTLMRQKHKIPVSEFRYGQFACYLVWFGPASGLPDPELGQWLTT
jgi:hypothetical protein